MKVLPSDKPEAGASAGRLAHPLRLAVSILLGNAVFNTTGKLLGKIKDVMIDLAAGKVEYVVIGFGGFLGINQKHFVVPMQSLTVSTARPRAFVLNERKSTPSGIAKTGEGPLTRYKFPSN